MERFMKRFADVLDRRSFFRRVGKLGMGAAAMAGVLLLPRQAASTPPPHRRCNPKSETSWQGLRVGDQCSLGPCTSAGTCVTVPTTGHGVICGCR